MTEIPKELLARAEQRRAQWLAEHPGESLPSMDEVLRAMSHWPTDPGSPVSDRLLNDIKDEISAHGSSLWPGMIEMDKVFDILDRRFGKK